MAQDRNLPEGTDKITPGAAETVEEVVVVEAVVAEPANPRGGGAAGAGNPSNPGTDTPGTAEAAGSARGAGGAQSSGRQSGGGQSGGGQGGGNEGSTRQKIVEQVRSGSEKLSGQAAEKTRDFVGQGLERSGDALSNVSRLINDTASGIDERLGAEYGDYARRAAEAIDSTAEKLRTKNPDELIDDTRNFVRKSPGVALAGAAIVGFALARLVKSGLDAAGRENESRDDQGGRGGGSA